MTGISVSMTSSSDTNGNRSLFHFLFPFQHFIIAYCLDFSCWASEIPQNSLVSARLRLPRDSVPSNTCDTRCFFVLEFLNFFFNGSPGHQAIDLNRFFLTHPMGTANSLRFHRRIPPKGQPKSLYQHLSGSDRHHQP